MPLAGVFVALVAIKLIVNILNESCEFTQYPGDAESSSGVRPSAPPARAG